MNRYAGTPRNRTATPGGAQFDITAPGLGDGRAGRVLTLWTAAIAIWLAATQRLFGDGDTGWHIGAGRHILRTGTIPDSDPFSFTMPGAAWTAHEWLAEVLMAGAFDLADWRALALLFAIAAAGTMWLISREVLRFLPVRWALCAAFVIAVMLEPMASARPHMLAWPLLTLWTLLLLRARDRGRAPPLASAAIMLVWANLHASYIFAIGIAGLFALEALVAQHRQRPVILRWALFLLLTLAAACVTPHGVQGFLYPFQVSSMRALTLINEWRATNFADDKLFILCASGLWLLVLRRWRRLHPLRLLLLAGLTVLAVLHARHQMLFTIVGALLAAPLTAGDRGELARPRGWQRDGLGMLAGLGLALVVARLAIPYRFADTERYPLSLIERLPPALRSRPVLNEYSLGGPLILSGVRPYIDGRADMYGDEFTFDHHAIMKGDIVRFRAAVERWKIGWVILPVDTRLGVKLDREPGWRRLAETREAVVYVPGPNPRVPVRREAGSGR